MVLAIRSKSLSAVRTARAIRPKKIVSRSKDACYPLKEKSSAFRTVRVIPFKKIRQPFQLSVQKKQNSNYQFSWPSRSNGSSHSDSKNYYCQRFERFENIPSLNNSPAVKLSDLSRKSSTVRIRDSAIRCNNYQANLSNKEVTYFMSALVICVVYKSLQAHNSHGCCCCCCFFFAP